MKKMMVLITIMMVVGSLFGKKEVYGSSIRDSFSFGEAVALRLEEKLNETCGNEEWDIDYDKYHDVIFISHNYLKINSGNRVTYRGDWFIDGCPDYDELKRTFESLPLKTNEEAVEVFCGKKE